MRHAGLLRLRARHAFVYRGELLREGDCFTVETAAEAQDLCRWGRAELTPQAREAIFGSDPWPLRLTMR